jgi:hypothetical protein
MPDDIIPTELAIRAMRDSGYRNTAYALAELLDNSAQAKASLIEVFCIEDTELINERRRKRIKEIAVLDNGDGMSEAILRKALQFGNGTYLSDRSGIGRFGMGLPNSSISQGRRVDVWTWQSGPDNAIHCYLDVTEIEAGTLRVVPPASVKAIPTEWRNRGHGFGTTGTLVIWSKLDEDRLTWKTAKSTLANTEALIGRMYRKFINRGDLRITLKALEQGSDDFLPADEARVNDPLYLMSPSSTPAPFNEMPMFQRYGEEDTEFPIEVNGETHIVTVRASWAKPETLPENGKNRGDESYGKHAHRNLGVSIVRADRELDLDASWTISYDPTERWWGVEVDFPPGLDEVFGVTNNKQAANVFSHMVSFDWTSEAEPGEERSDFIVRLRENGDPRAELIGIVDHIRSTIKKLRTLLQDQTKGRRSPGRRHDDTSVEDRASTKFKERAESGHKTPSDSEVFDDAAKEALIEDLTEEKQYPESDARAIAEAVQKRDRKVLFVLQSSDMDAFFAVEQKPGGITEIILNREHPAHELLIKTLDETFDNSTERELIERIGNASETIKMLFAAWARQEIEDVPNRERLRRMRQDWGRMARDFLLDGEK